MSSVRWPTSANLYINAVTTQQFVVLWTGNTSYTTQQIVVLSVLSLTRLFTQHNLYGESMVTPVNYAYSVAILMLSHNNISQAIFTPFLRCTYNVPPRPHVLLSPSVSGEFLCYGEQLNICMPGPQKLCPLELRLSTILQIPRLKTHLLSIAVLSINGNIYSRLFYRSSFL